MEAYRRTITDPDMIELYGEIMAAFGEYQPSMQQIMESARVNAPPVQMIIMMNALAEPTDFVMEALYYLAYVRVLEATHVNDVNSYLSNVLLVVIIAVIAVSIAVALFLAKYISGLIGRPLAEIGLFANRVSTGEINMANVSRNSIDVGSSDEIGALARILEQSYAQLSEYERSKYEMQCLAADNAALERVNRLRAEMVATISHEARTPLAVLSGYASLVALEMQEKNTDPKTVADLDKIAYEAKRVANLIDHMKNLPLRKDRAARKTRLDLAALIEQTARLYRHILERIGVSLVTDTPGDLPPAFGNPDELTQVLFNLLQNAKNHTANGDEVVIKARNETGRLTVIVADTGKGIAPELLPLVFERGIQGDGEGMGIGLSVCREIVEAQGGTIGVESEPGKGTSVTFTLPVYEGGEADDE